MNTAQTRPQTKPLTEASCGEIPLDVLLHADEDSAEFKKIAAHVESCHHCQEQLGHMSGSAEDWAEMQDLLRPDELDRQPRRRAAEARPDSHRDRVRLDFLAAPSHPEMLGRLGRYEIEQLIGSGGMGIVLKGFDTELHRPVAIKVLAPHLADSGAARRRFAREAKAAAAVVHEHVVAIHNVESAEEVPFLVMQYVPGRSLADRVEQDGPLEVAEILRIGMQAAAGLAAAHAQGVIHRDIKPANILLENGVERALLTDFGLARAAEDASLTRSGIIAGTPHYMSPEQARGEPADTRSDLFSLGAVLYFMAAGHAPFRAEQAMAVLHRVCHDRQRPLWEINAQLPDELIDVIDRLLEKKPSRRFAAASDVEQALARVLSQVQQPRPWRAGTWLRRLRRHRTRIATAIGAVVAVLVLGWCASRPGQGGDGDKTAGAIPASNGETPPAPLPKPDVAEPASPKSFQKSLHEQSRQQVEFVRELIAIDQSLRSLSARPHPETTVLQGDPWLKELGAANRDVTRWERSWSVGPNGSSSDNFKGEKL